jgi:PIN domain nuclease of toxin-antitoxin system
MRRILLDTHVYFWWATNDRKLSPQAYAAIEDYENQVLVSVVTAWELATKARIGKWPGAAQVVTGIDEALATRGLESLPVNMTHARLAGFLPGTHRDPFDRMLAAQAQTENLLLVTSDRVFRDFGVQVLW